MCSLCCRPHPGLRKRIAATQDGGTRRGTEAGTTRHPSVQAQSPRSTCPGRRRETLATRSARGTHAVPAQVAHMSAAVVPFHPSADVPGTGRRTVRPERPPPFGRFDVCTLPFACWLAIPTADGPVGVERGVDITAVGSQDSCQRCAALPLCSILVSAGHRLIVVRGEKAPRCERLAACPDYLIQFVAS